MLAMDVNDNAGCLNGRGVLAFFASRLAPTGDLRSAFRRGLTADLILAGLCIPL